MFTEMKDRQVGPDLLSGFFSAMCLFSKELINKKPEIMEIEDVRLVFKEYEGYIFVAIVDENESIAQIQDILNKISIKFLQNYESYLKNWDRNVEIFNDFGKQIEMVIIKADIDRMMLIEKLENLLESGDQSKIEGILILTTKGDLMLSGISDNKLKQYLVKTIENNWRMGFQIKQMVIQLNYHHVIIEQISDFLLAAVVLKNYITIDFARAMCKYLFKRLKLQVQQRIQGAPEISD